MSRRITQKEVRATHVHVIAVPYCGLYSLLYYYAPYAHTERAEQLIICEIYKAISMEYEKEMSKQ